MNMVFFLIWKVYLLYLKTYTVRDHIIFIKTVKLLMLAAAVSGEEEIEETTDKEKQFQYFKLLFK